MSNPDKTIEALQLRLIEVEAELISPTNDDPFTFMTSGRRKLEYERDVIRKKIAFIQAGRTRKQKGNVRAGRKLSPTKQEAVYKKVEAEQKRHPNLTKTAIFSKLSDKMTDSTEESIKKAYYAQSAKLTGERKKKQKGDAESKSDQQNQGETKLPEK